MKGACLCRAVTYEVSAPLRGLHGCHCTQCRKQSGHFVVSASAPRDAVASNGAEHLSWYSASPGIRRGFCRICGSHLIWDADGDPELSLNAGAFESPTEIEMERHIFCADKGDYYELDDGLPQYEAYPEKS